ncbi:MAG: NAD(P)/FAD-dependent oxidoreductase [bacterium]
MIRIRQIKIDVDSTSISNLKKLVANKLDVNVDSIENIYINKRSLDARKKPKLYFIYEVDITINNEEYLLSKNKSQDVLKSPDTKYTLEKTGINKIENLCIVGAGPAGLMCAYTLAKNGFKPIIIERGKPVEQRVEDINEFWETGMLKTNSNVQFGEGGAGTFSDGKLNTLIKDKECRCKYFFETLVQCGAPDDILYDAKPHIGTNLLRNVIINLRKEIIQMGGTFKYDSLVTDITMDDSSIKSIVINNDEEIDTNCVVFAIGHSARDTFRMLYNKKIEMESKPFAIGLRIMHNQKMINKSQIGIEEHQVLKQQSYKLTHNTIDKRGVFTFCMCPGGYVVNASSHENKLVVNGMSNHERESGVANSAIIVTIDSNDYGNEILDGLKYIENIESSAFNLLNGAIPIQLFSDYKNNIKTTKLGNIKPAIKGKYDFANLRNILSEEIDLAIIDAINNFGRKIKNFDIDDSILAGVETRTSSPIKIVRTEGLESSISGIFPCGEGSGHAGGITSAAIDGIKVAEAIAKKYLY